MTVDEAIAAADQRQDKGRNKRPSAAHHVHNRTAEDRIGVLCGCG